MVSRTSPPSGEGEARVHNELMPGADAGRTGARRVDRAMLANRQSAAIVVIDRRLLIRDCLVRCLREIDPACNVLAYSSVSEWLEATTQHIPILILFSVQPQDSDDSEFQQSLGQLKQNKAGAPVMIISDSEDTSRVVSILQSGARGYLPTSVTLNVALEAMRLVGAGGTFAPINLLLNARAPSEVIEARCEEGKPVAFTARQLAVLVALRHGKANKQIAYELNMREGTVKVHVRHIMKKLNARNRTEVAIIAKEMISTSNKAS